MLLPRPLTLKPKVRQPPELGPVVRVEAVHLSTGADESKLAALIKRRGLSDWDNDGLREQSTDIGTMWHGACTKDLSLEFELPGPVPLGAIEVWNFNAEWQTTNGLRKADIAISADGNTWQTVLRGAEFAEAEGRDDYDQPAVLTLKDVTARKVRFENMVPWGGTAMLGLSKVIFHQALGPQAGPRQPEDGAVAVSLNRPQLEWLSGQGASAHRVYFGAAADKLELLGEAQVTHLQAPALKPDTTYFWRVDEVQTGDKIISGRVARFESAGLVAWWKLDETEGAQAADAAGNENPGSVFGKPHWAPAHGRIGGALEFDGKSNCIDGGRSSEFDCREGLTVSAWIKARALDKPWQAIVTKGDTAWRLQRAKDSANVTFDLNLGSTVENGIENLATARSKRTLDDGLWHHLAGVFEGTQVSLYVDGELQESAPAKAPLARNMDAVMIGDNAARRGRFFDGWIDDVRIYGYGLKPEAVQALYRGAEFQRASR